MVKKRLQFAYFCLRVMCRTWGQQFIEIDKGHQQYSDSVRVFDKGKFGNSLVARDGAIERVVSNQLICTGWMAVGKKVVFTTTPNHVVLETRQ